MTAPPCEALKRYDVPKGGLVRRTGWGGGLLILLVVASPAAAQEGPVSVRADQVEYNETAGKVVAVGNVVATRDRMKLTCDRAVIFMETHDAYLTGRVRLYEPSALLKGEEILYNFKTHKGTVLKAATEAGPFRTAGEQGTRLAKQSFLHRDGYVTTCDFEQPHTRLQAKEVRIYLDERVVLKNAVGYVGNVPLLYLPSYTHPLDDKRPRVTIIPGKDKQWGLFLLTAWRVYLNENLQGRFHVDFRERLDLATGLDLKYKLPFGGEGIFREYYTHERALQRDHFWSSVFKPEKDKPTAERERYRVQIRHVWTPDDRTRATLEYNRVKDPTVVKDFFLREFEEDTASPASYFQVIRTGTWYGLTFLTQWRANRFETTTQTLPSVELNVRPLRIPFLPAVTTNQREVERFPAEASGLREGMTDEARQASERRRAAGAPGWYYQASFDYAHTNVKDKQNGTEASLTKFDTTHEIFHPMRLWRWFNFRPFFAFRETMFSRGKEELAPQFRQAASTGFDMSAKLFRVFPVTGSWMGVKLNKLRHVITPTLSYEYQAKPTISDDKLLRSDGLAKRNVMTPALEQKLQTKRPRGDGGYDTVDLVRFLAQMPYDIEGGSGRGGEWRNTTLDLEMVPYDWLRVEADAAINPHISKFETINADLVARPGLSKHAVGLDISNGYDSATGRYTEVPWAVGMGWRYVRNTSAQLTFQGVWQLNPKWRFSMFQTLDVKNFVPEATTTGERTVKKIYDFPEQEYRLRRDLHEWTAELVWNTRRSQGESLLLLFRLKAFPVLPFEFKRSYHQPKAGRNFLKR